MQRTQIGIVTVQYNPEGKLLSAIFKPTLKVELSPEVIQNLEKNVDKSEQSDVIKFNSDFVLGTFFSKMTEIELADREIKEVVSEVQQCTQYNDGKTNTCVIAYYFQDRVRATAQA